MTEITRPFAPVPDKSTQTSAKLAEGKETRMYVFPRRVLLQLPSLERVIFEMGPQAVPVDILNDPTSLKWLTDNGAKPHVAAPVSAGAASVAATVNSQEVTDHHVRFLQQRGYPSVKTIADAQRFVSHIPPIERAGFFFEASEWKGPQPNESLDQNAAPAAAPQERQAAEAGKPAEDPNAGKGNETLNPDAGADAGKLDDANVDNKAASATAGAQADVTVKDKPAGNGGKASGKNK